MAEDTCSDKPTGAASCRRSPRARGRSRHTWTSGPGRPRTSACGPDAAAQARLRPTAAAPAGREAELASYLTGRELFDFPRLKERHARFAARIDELHDACPRFRTLLATAPPTLSFWNLVEVYLLASICRSHNVAMQKARPALQYLERELDLERPLPQKQLLTDGVNLFVEHLSSLINISEDGHVVVQETIVGSLKRIERDPAGFPMSMSPWRRDYREAREGEIDPHRASGRRGLRP